LLIDVILLSLALNFIVFTIGNKNLYLNNIVILILLCFYLLRALVRGKVIFNKHFIPLIFFIIYFVFTILISGNKEQSIIQYIIFMQPILFSILIINSISNSLALHKNIFVSYSFFFFFILLRIIINNYAVFLNLSTSNRFDLGFIGGVNNFSYLLDIAIVITIILIKRKPIKIFLTGFFIIILSFTLSRGGVLTLLIVFLYIFNFFELLAKKKNLIIGIFLLFIVFLSVVFLINTDISAVFINRYLKLDLTGSGRLEIWYNVVKKIFDNSQSFLFGNGPGTFKYEIYSGKIMNSTHNQYLDFLYNFGIVGFSLFFGYLLYIIKKICNTSNNDIKKVLLSIFLIYFLSFIFDSHLWVVQTNWIFGLFLSSAIKYLDISKKQINK